MAALVCICVGIFRVWQSFRSFDEALLNEKDTQFYSLLRSDDINIKNSINSFVRESETFFERDRLRMLRQAWTSSEDRDTTDLENYFRENTVSPNPIYADVLMLNKGKIILSASGNLGYTFMTEASDENLRICTDNNGNYYLAYEYNATGNVRYEALIDLGQLYVNALGSNPGGGLMLIDRTSTLMIRKPEKDIIITPVADGVDEDTARCRDFLVSCQEAGKSGGTSLTLTGDDGKEYTARMVVIPSSDTVNAEFAIGISANYEEAIGPSRAAARDILIYGGVAITGILIILFMLILMRRINIANSMELEMLKKKNETMEELNQNMQALTHHQRLETIGTMTASIAHDFNNLLTPIMGYSMMSMEMLPDDETEIQEYLMEVYNASVKAKDIVTRLAELTKKGKEENFTELDPDEVIGNSLKVTLPAKPKTVDVKIRFRAGGRLMKGDSTQIAQLAMNIILNAYDEMRESGGTLYVSTGVEDERIAIRFRDTGHGMDAETIARIFDPFYTTKESGKGTGLGLAIVAQIAETHGGKVYVDSVPGQGTEFRITFPMIEARRGLDKTKTIQINTAELRALLQGEPPRE